jgi:hypothetical protein
VVFLHGKKFLLFWLKITSNLSFPAIVAGFFLSSLSVTILCYKRIKKHLNSCWTERCNGRKNHGFTKNHPKSMVDSQTMVDHWLQKPGYETCGPGSSPLIDNLFFYVSCPAKPQNHPSTKTSAKNIENF